MCPACNEKQEMPLDVRNGTTKSRIFGKKETYKLLKISEAHTTKTWR